MFQRQPWMQRACEYPRSDREYFNLLARAVFSAGLGPKVVESRWAGMSVAFHDFDPKVVASMDESDVARLLSSTEVIRNRRKIEAVIANAVVFLDEVDAHGSFHSFLESTDPGSDLTGAIEALCTRFAHLGRTSAALFLYSAGWRQRESVDSEEQPDPDIDAPACPQEPAELPAAQKGRRGRGANATAKREGALVASA